MTAVWYIGGSDVRVISAAQWAAAGVSGAADSQWDKTNGWSIPATSFTSAQLAIMASLLEFNTTAADGPRPGASSGVISSDQNYTTKAYVDSKDLSQGQWGSGSPVTQMLHATVNALRRQHVRANRVGPATTDVTSFATSGSIDGTLTKVYGVWATGLTNGQSRLLTANELATQAFDLGVGRPITLSVSGTGYAYPTPNGGIDTPTPSQWPNITLRIIKFMTDAPKIDALFYSPIQSNLVQIFIDGLPATAGAAPIDPGFLTFLHLVLPSDKKPRLIEFRTGAFFGGLRTAPSYKCWQPPPPIGPRVLAIGDSYMSPTAYDSVTGAAAKDLNGWAQVLADYIDIDHMWIEGIPGTGFIQRSAGAYGNPNNNYLDRITGHITTVKPDVVLVGSAFSNDMKLGNSVASSVANAHSYFTQMRAARPNCKFIVIDGWRAPLYGDFTTQYAQCIAALQALRQDVYYIQAGATLIDAGGGYIPGHTSGTENSNMYIGVDGVHPVVEGHTYIRGRLAPAIQRCLHDTGTLINTVIAA